MPVHWRRYMSKLVEIKEKESSEIEKARTPHQQKIIKINFSYIYYQDKSIYLIGDYK